MAYEALGFQALRNNVLRIAHPSLPTAPSSYVTSPNSAGGTSLTVRDTTGFADTDLILLGNFGDEQAEIKKINGAVSAGTSLTTTAMTFAHAINTPVRKIIFDQIEIYGNSLASSSGATLITTIAIDPTAPFTEYINTGSAFAYYGVRGIRSVATTYQGSYSDFVAAVGFDTNTVGFVIQQAFDQVGEKIRQDGKFSLQWAFDQIFLGEQDVAKELKKWSWLTEFEYDAGNIALGVNYFTLPTNISDKNSPKAIQGLRIGTGRNLRYISKSVLEELFQNVGQTTVGTTYVSGATSIILTDSRDMVDSGSINVYTGSTIDAVSYTTNTRSTNTLSGVTSNDSGGTAGDPVWQYEPRGIPCRYTIYEGVVYFDAVPDTTTNLVGSNIWLDYYKNVTRVTSVNSTLTVPDPLCIQKWLEAQIKTARLGGNLPADDTSMIDYKSRKKRLIDLETNGQGTYIVPSIPDSDVFYADPTLY